MIQRAETQDMLFAHKDPADGALDAERRIITPIVRERDEPRVSEAYADLGGLPSTEISVADTVDDTLEPSRLTAKGQAAKQKAIHDAQWASDSELLKGLQIEMREKGLSEEDALRQWHLQMGLRAVQRAQSEHKRGSQ